MAIFISKPHKDETARKKRGVRRICKAPPLMIFRGKDFILSQENSSPKLKSNNETPSSAIASISSGDLINCKLPGPPRTIPAIR